MAAKFCPYCKCLILSNGKCRNTKCILGNKDAATLPQIELIYRLCSEMGISLEGKDPNKLTKDRASKIIKDLISRKTLSELYGSEVEAER